jgi:hypothetical protein
MDEPVPTVVRLFLSGLAMSQAASRLATWQASHQQRAAGDYWLLPTTLLTEHLNGVVGSNRESGVHPASTDCF